VQCDRPGDPKQPSFFTTERTTMPSIHRAFVGIDGLRVLRNPKA
jgi:hypothetical protein